MNEQQIFFAFIMGTAVLTILTISLGAFLLVHKKRQARNKLEKQQLEFVYETELLKTRLNEQEKSLTLISEEIHDNIGQVLGLTKMYLYKLIQATKDEEASQFGRMAVDFLTQAIGDLRHISHSLNSDLLAQTGLENSIEREISYLQETTKMQCSLHSKGSPVELPREKNILVFRVIQEALQNVVKHSEAKSLSLTLAYNPDSLEISIEDDGKGFNVDQARDNNTLGMRNIRNRANLLQAEFSVQSSHNEGTSLLLKIPLNSCYEQELD